MYEEYYKLKLLEIMQKIWKSEGFFRNWRKEVIVPIYKKGDKDKAANYYGIAFEYRIQNLRNDLRKKIKERRKKDFTRNTSKI